MSPKFHLDLHPESFMDFWTVICGRTESSCEAENSLSNGYLGIICPHCCTNHLLVISVDFLIILILLVICFKNFSLRKSVSSSHSSAISLFSVSPAIFIGGLGLVYLGLWILTVAKRLVTKHTLLPLPGWLVLLFNGATWLLLCFLLNLIQSLPSLPSVLLIKISSVLTLLLSGFLCITSMWEVIVHQIISFKIVLDMFSLPAAIFLTFSAFTGQKYVRVEGENGDAAVYAPLQCKESDANSTVHEIENVTTFAKAGFISRMSFWWLNHVMKTGKGKTLEGEDIPEVRPADQAETCYNIFLEEMNKQKQQAPSKTPPLTSIIFRCHRKAILVSGLFALIKTLALCTSPLFLYAFIEVAEGKEAFKYEGYALTAGLLFVKLLESVSERQWFFNSRITGLQVKSLLTAAIYQKQLRLSNAAKTIHSPGQIMNYVTVDAHNIGEFPYWFHQIWAMSLQVCLSLSIVYYSIGMATIVAIIVIILTVLGNSPLARLQLKYQTKFMVAQDKMLKAITEALTNTRVLKFYAWETHFMNAIKGLRTEEAKCLSAVQLQRGYYLVLFFSSPILVSIATFGACYFLRIPLYESNVFTFLATLRMVQEPIRRVPDVIGVFIQAKVSLSRIQEFLEAPELQTRNIRQKRMVNEPGNSISIMSTEISWNTDALKPTLRNISLCVQRGDKVAICGEVGAGKSTLIAALLGEVPIVNGIVEVHGKVAYVSQKAWIQTGTIAENILFGSPMAQHRYQEVLEKCSLVKDLGLLPFGDLTEIGERGTNLSGGQKQRIQLARALYQDADVYFLDDPFSAVDAHTATSLFNEYVMGALSRKTVLLVTHQVEFLPVFDSVLLMSEGEIVKAGTYDELMNSCKEFQNLVYAHNENAGSMRQGEHVHTNKSEMAEGEIKKVCTEQQQKASVADQLIKQEEREIGNTGLKPYLQYLKYSKGFLYFSLALLLQLIFIVGQLLQNYMLAMDILNSSVSRGMLITVYIVIGFGLILFLLGRALFVLGLEASKSIFVTLINSLFRAPMSFYDSTPMGRILSRVSSDLNAVDLDLPFVLAYTVGTALNSCASLGILVLVNWKVLFVIIPMIYLTILLQRFYSATAKELMRISGTTKSLVANHLTETMDGSTTIRAFGDEDRFFSKNLQLIDINARMNFHSFSATEWLIQRLEMICAVVVCSSALAMTLLHLGTSASGLIGMALSYGLSLNVFLIYSVQNQCVLENLIVSVERLEQYMHITSEAPEVVEANRPATNWPASGRVEIIDLKVRYWARGPLVLQGINCIFEGGHKIGIVGRTGSGKTTLISTLFRLVEPTEGKIVIDEVDISTFGLHDLRSRIGIIPQDPTLFSGTVRFNLDPLTQHTDQELWEVLEKCQLKEALQEKQPGLNSIVLQDGSNWSMGQRQLFCLGRALLKRSRILVLDEATASIDNATDSILQRTIRTEFADCTVITVAHRIPTVMDCTKVLAISDGKLVEFDEPGKLINKGESLFGQLVKEYWSCTADVGIQY